jgi:hypothetical protein
MTTSTADQTNVEEVSEEQIDAFIASLPSLIGVDIETLREFAKRGSFETEQQRRTWFTIAGLGRD